MFIDSSDTEEMSVNADMNPSIKAVKRLWEHASPSKNDAKYSLRVGK